MGGIFCCIKDYSRHFSSSHPTSRIIPKRTPLSPLVRSLIGLGSLLFVIIVGGFLFLQHLVTRSFSSSEGSEGFSPIHHNVEIIRDPYGVPHIRASNEHDLMAAIGYVHAQDRLWQMDMLRRAGEGRLSEVFGTPTVEMDKLFRTIGLRSIAEKMETRLHPKSRQILEDYTSGVNAFIETHRDNYPVEFDMLDYEPEPWKVSHSLLLVRLIAWELNLSWWTDLTYGEIATRVPPEMLQEIIPSYPDSIRPTVPRLQLRAALESARGFRYANRLYRELFGLGSLEAGSNAWAVDSTRSMSGKPMLANDPHLSMPSPARWYLLHGSAPGWNASGVSVPGVPVIVIGHNEHLAWGLTNAMLDDADYYLELVDTTKRSSYIFDGTSRPFIEREETIRIGKNDSLVIVVRESHHGPIINDVHPRHLHADSATHIAPIAMRWTGAEVSDEVYGFYLMNQATGADDFSRGLRELTVPGQAVVYADVEGNIGYWTTGRVPIRGNRQVMLPLSGATAASEWKGFVPFEQLPKLWNPPEGFIACSNQNIADAAYPHYLSTLWEPTSRIRRIRTLLQSSTKFTAEDFKQFQQDITSPFAQDVSADLLRAFEGTDLPDQHHVNALNYIRNWDYRFTQSDVTTTIFSVFFTRLVQNTFQDEMGNDLFDNFVFFGAIPYRVTSQLLAKDSSAWFDDIRTPVQETKEMILRKSLSDAIAELRSTIGDEMKTWQWGSLHTVTFRHPFGTRKPLDKVFNLGPFPVAGGGTTLNKCEYKFSSPYTVSVGPSMRQVIDLGDPLTAFTVITSGQSGQPLHDHYDDQIPLWLNGGYLSLSMDWREIERMNWSRLTLTPTTP